MQSYGDYVIDKKLIVTGTTALNQQTTITGGLTIKSGSTDTLVVTNSTGSITAAAGIFTFQRAVVQDGIAIISSAANRMVRFQVTGSSGMALLHETATAEGKLSFIKVNNAGAETSRMGWVDNTGLLWWEGTINGAKVIGRSDIKFKDEVVDFENALDVVLRSKPRRYLWKATKTKDFGFVAQELEQVIPEAVLGEDGSKGVNYQALVAVAFGAIKELHATVQKQSDELAALKSELEGLKSVSVAESAPAKKTKKASGG